MLTRKMGFRDFLRMPKKMTLLLLFVGMIPYMVGSRLRGEEVEFVIEWDGKGVSNNEQNR